MFIHLHEPEAKSCDNCGHPQVVMFMSAVQSERTISLCRTCLSKAIPAFAMVGRKLNLNDSGSEKGPKLSTLKELAELLSVHECTIYRQVKAGRIPFVRVGGEYRFNSSVVIAKLTADTRSASLAQSLRRNRLRTKRAQRLRLVAGSSPAPGTSQTHDSSDADRADGSGFDPHPSRDSAA